MALIGVQPVQNPSLQPGHYRPAEKKTDLDKILEGLQVAHQAMGIGVDYTTIQNHMAQTSAMEDANNGVLSKGELLGAQLKGAMPAAADQPGSIPYRVRTGPNDEDIKDSPLIMATKPDRPVVTHAINNYKDPKTGQMGTAFVDASNPGSGVLGFVAQQTEKQAKEPTPHYSTLADSTGKLFKTNTLTGEVTPVDTGDATFGKGGGGGADKANAAQEKIYSDAYKEARTARGEPGVQQAMKALVNVKNADGVISKYVTPDMTPEQQIEALNKMTPQEASFLTSELGKIASGGVASEHTQNSMSAHTLDSGWAEFKQKFGKPQGAELGAFILNNKGYLDELRQANQGVVDDHVNSVFKENENRFTPDQQQRWKQDQNFARLFKTEGPSKAAAGPVADKGGGFVGTANAGPQLAPTKSGYMPGSVLDIDGVHYRVSDDGKTAVPVGGK